MRDSRDPRPQRSQVWVTGEGDLAGQTVQEVVTPLFEVPDAWCHSKRVQAGAQNIDRRGKQRRVDALDQDTEGCIGRHQIPVPVHYSGGIGLMTAKDDVECFAYRSHRCVVEGSFSMLWCETCGEQ